MLRHRAATAALLLALAAGAGAVPPGDCPAVDPPAAAAPRVRVFVDPATGKLREPTPDELRAIAEKRLADRQAAPPRVFEIVTRPDGTRSVDLGDAFLFDLRVVRLPDGTATLTCVPRSPAGRPAAAK